MKATKAGAIIGTALTGFNGDGVGQVVVFVKNGVGNGSKVTGNNVEVLSNLVNLPQTNTTTDISNVTTDKVVAGMEIITPKITTQDILATGLFVMTDKDGNENVKISSSGDATLSGTLVVDTIKARRIEGMDIITKKLSLLSEEVAGVSTVSAQPTPSIPTETNILDLISKAISDIYKNTAEFLGRVIFHNDVAFLGRPTFNKDTAGFAIIKSGDSEVEVKFDKEYTNEPVVNATLQIAGAVDMNNLPSYAVADVDTKGFKVRLARSTSMDIRFSWIAIAVNNATNITSNGGTTVTATPAPTPIATPTPSATVTSTISLDATVSATPTPTATITPVPTEIPSPTPTPVITIQPTQAATSSGNL